MKLRFRYIYLLSVVFLINLVSCVDNTFDSPRVQEGNSLITATIKFNRFRSTNLGTRSAGDAYDQIRNLQILVYNADGDQLIKREIIEKPSATSEYPADEVTASFYLPYDRYQIYAVANVDELFDKDMTYLSSNINTVDELKAYRLTWKEPTEGVIGANDQMLGYFTTGATEDNASEQHIVTVNNATTKLYSKLVRAVSKVTVAYDGTRLKDDVSIKIESLSIKKIPAHCFLGDPNTANVNNPVITDGETVTYEGAVINNTSALSFYPPKEMKDGSLDWSEENDPHSHDNIKSLFFYENLQGVHDNIHKDIIDTNGNGELDEDEKFPFEQLPYATYIEVKAYYESTNPERPGVGNMIYRFMLGNNITTNYDAERNHHYKLTLCFNGFANDYDWRIDPEKFLVVPDPAVVDYRGDMFIPNYGINNLGNVFSKDNDIIVESYERNLGDGTKEFLPFTITYSSVGENNFTETKPEWLATPVIEDTADPLQKKVKFRYETNVPEVFTVGDKITGSLGSAEVPHNLAGEGSDMTNTANCYIVGAKGYYMFPLVYGNARTDGKDYADSYTGFAAGDRVLTTLVNYKTPTDATGENGGQTGISSPYILNDIYGESIPEGIKASLIWEDAENFVQDVEYVSDAYNGKGGIKFNIPTVPTGGANAVIAIKNPEGTVMWSWHIWMTYSKFFDDLAVELKAWNSSGNYEPTYTIMPVNLGWCHGEDEEISYYEKHECDVKISNGTLSRVITIIQESHLAVPLGNSPYYQWGRKDPFIAAGKGDNTNKQWWYYGNWEFSDEQPKPANPMNCAPSMLNHFTYTIDSEHTDRPLTKNVLYKLIQNPGVWNNPRCKIRPNWETEHNSDPALKWVSDDEIYSNLWTNNIKTVYDPCPIGYQVSPRGCFAPFVNGDDVQNPNNWFCVLPSRMLDGYRENMVDFYPTQQKMISTGFPECGYRDYDNKAQVTIFGKGHIWYAENLPGTGYDANNNSYYFYYYIENPNFTTDEVGAASNISPLWWAYFPCDGFAVRPTKKATN